MYKDNSDQSEYIIDRDQWTEDERSPDYGATSSHCCDAHKLTERPV